MGGANCQVSVAMCTFNGERFIRQQLESILNQSRPPDEVVVCDDGSTDRTLDIVDQLGRSSSSRIRVIRNPQNLGYIKNFEKAVSEATGDVIFLSDFDDVWFKDRIAAMLVPFMEDPEVVVAYCDAVLTDPELRPASETFFERRSHMGVRTTPTIHQIGRGPAFNGNMIALHSRLRPYVIPFSNQWASDHWIGAIAYAVGKVAPVDRPLMFYRRHGTNVGADPDLDGGFWYRLRVRVGKSELKQYAQRCRRFDDIVKRLQEIKDRGAPLKGQYPLQALLDECEDCLRFARIRKDLKQRSRLRRLPTCLHSFARGDYHRHAHGVMSFFQDTVIR